MRQLRLLFVVPYYKPAYVYGGPSRSVPALCKGLVEAGAHVTVLTTNANGVVALDVPTDTPVLVDGVKVHYLARSPYVRARYFYSPDVVSMCRRTMPEVDIVYAFGPWTHPMLVAGSFARRIEKPYVVSPRGCFMEWSMRQGSLKKRLYLTLLGRRCINSAASIHCTSRLELEQTRKMGFRAPLLSIPNPVDMHLVSRKVARGSFRERLNIPQGAPLSLFVGRLHREKRLGRTVEAFNQVVSAVSGAHMLIVGEHEDDSAIAVRREVVQRGLSHRVHFLGALTGDDLAQAYRDADLLVLLSHRESFAMVAAEAMAMGLAVLLSKDVGLANEAAEAGAGVCVDADGAEVEREWINLLHAPRRREEMGNRGKELARERFSSEAVAYQMLALFSSVLGGGSLIAQD